jgi:hypothetical protein
VEFDSDGDRRYTMNRVSCYVRQWSVLGAFAILLLLLTPWPTSADGVSWPPYPVPDFAMPDQKAIIVYDAQRQREELILSVQLLGGPEAAWVIPVPSRPEVREASADWFDQLARLTRPAPDPGVWGPTLALPAGPESTPVLDVVRKRVGIYDVGILSGGDSTALHEWLNRNGYDFPDEGKPILDVYVNEGSWYFVAARVHPDESSADKSAAGETAQLAGDVQPLWFSFDTAQPMYPMRLTALVENPIDVLIYVLGDHRMRTDDFVTEYADRQRLEPLLDDGRDEDETLESEEGSLEALLTGREYYVTKLRRTDLVPGEISDDLYLQRSGTDTPVHGPPEDPVRALVNLVIALIRRWQGW